MAEKQTGFSGILLGLVANEKGDCFIGMDVNGYKVILEKRTALVLFDQLGDLLDSLGAFADVEDEDMKEIRQCH